MAWYEVETQNLNVGRSITYLPSELFEPEWESIIDIPMLDTLDEELAEARKVAEEARKYHVHVRIVKINPNGTRELVA